MAAVPVCHSDAGDSSIFKEKLQCGAHVELLSTETDRCRAQTLLLSQADKVRRVRAFAGAPGAQPTSAVLPAFTLQGRCFTLPSDPARCLLRGKMGFGRFGGLITVGSISFRAAAPARLQVTAAGDGSDRRAVGCVTVLPRPNATHSLDGDVARSFELDNEG